MLSNRKSVFWIVAAAVVCIAGTIYFFAGSTRGASDEACSMLMVNGETYVNGNPSWSAAKLPDGYTLAGTLTVGQAYDTGMEGLEYYTHPDRDNTLYVYQEPTSSPDSSAGSGASAKSQRSYGRWMKLLNDGGEHRILTLEDVISLSEKGNDLKWTDFDPYSYFETGSGLYIRVYVIDDRFSVLVGGSAYPENPMYFYLQLNDDTETCIDIRTDDVKAFMEKYSN